MKGQAAPQCCKFERLVLFCPLFVRQSVPKNRAMTIDVQQLSYDQGAITARSVAAQYLDTRPAIITMSKYQKKKGRSLKA
jgi:hypothetical protein